MSIFDFIANGGLFGMTRGFDHKKAGHAYGFSEFNDDIGKIHESMKGIKNTHPEKLLRNGEENYDER